MLKTLPLWRLIAGLGIYAALGGVFIDLAPVYIDNYHLGRYIQTLSSQTASPPDGIVQNEVSTQAHKLGLPVAPGDVTIAHTPGKLQIEARYHVQMILFHVDLKMSAR